ncbi:DinB family protein [Algoriphagus halophytocola]|uniref:DinB family protein n=1 Tax=Algoriphagus halophytocola TaxID=2991499 RepID=A0ABY6MN23_9BACT|nr:MULTISPECIES: DinB family protein [unclassified Algoriphagus]UZD23604.1 DinB family protein [Algoriphagus sp. TR-M5]WBL44897.1 DinB family protein [Algoriphagus sp. TR-M9]
MKTIEQPKEGDYSAFFSTYLKQTSGNNYEEQLLEQTDHLVQFFSSKADGWVDQPYELGKWTPKEVLGHIIDTERIMAFRALCIARGEKASLPGFDQDPYVVNGKFGKVSIADLLDNFVAQRLSLISMLKILPDGSLDLVGSADGNSITPRALLWIIPGHFAHHLQILRARY